MKKDRNHIKIPFSGLKDGIHEFHFDADARDTELPENFEDSVSIDIRMEKVRDRMFCRLQVYCAANFECDRCLKSIRLTMAPVFHLLCTSDQNEARQLGEEEDLKILNPNDHEVDFTEDIRQYILLSIPIKKTCGLDDHGNPLCEGEIDIFARVVEEEKPDPRWEQLKKLHLE